MNTKNVPIPPLGTWEKHTKGIGSKLLSKFGFTGRLGANEDGIAKAIEVSVRPVNVGLGFGDVDARKPSKEDAKTHQKQTKRNAVDVEQAASSQGWKKTKYDKVSKQAEFDNFFQEFTSFVGKSSEKVNAIIDMRQKDVRIITDLNDLTADHNLNTLQSSSSQPVLGAELLYNINTLAEQDKLTVANTARRAREERSILEKYSQEHTQLKQQLYSEQLREKRLSSLLDMFQQLQTITNTLPQTAKLHTDELLDTLDAVRSLVESMYRVSSEEFVSFGVSQVLTNLLIRLLTPFLTLSSTSSAVIDSLLTCCEVLVLVNQHWQLLTSFFIDKQENSLAHEINSALTRVIDRDYLPTVRRFIAGMWDPMEECEVAVQLFVTLSKLPSITAQLRQIEDEYLLPRLLTTVQKWSHKSSPSSSAGVPLHVWLLPWLPILTQRLSLVYPETRRQLGNILRSSSMHIIHDHKRAIDVLVPWKGVFDVSSFDNLLHRLVIPKLVDFLRDEVTIDPSNQDLTLLQSILAWHDILPSGHMACLIAGEFFPKWLTVLLQWLSQSDVDFGELSTWYSGWKGFFSANLLSEANGLCEMAFNAALDLMQERLTLDSDEQDVSVHMNKIARPLIEKMERNNYYILVRQLLPSVSSQHQTTEPQKSNSSKTNLSQHHHNLSLKEILELLAEQNNLEFAPRQGKQAAHGKPVYQFGRSSLYLTGDVVYVEQQVQQRQGQMQEQQRKDWIAMALDDLVRVSK